MKDKIEINQSDLLELLVSKIKFMVDEYRILYNLYHHKNGKIKDIDRVALGTSYEKFLKEEGDIKRLLSMYELFFEDKVSNIEE